MVMGISCCGRAGSGLRDVTWKGRSYRRVYRTLAVMSSVPNEQFTHSREALASWSIGSSGEYISRGDLSYHEATATALHTNIRSCWGGELQKERAAGRCVSEKDLFLTAALDASSPLCRPSMSASIPVRSMPNALIRCLAGRFHLLRFFKQPEDSQSHMGDIIHRACIVPKRRNTNSRTLERTDLCTISHLIECTQPTSVITQGAGPPAHRSFYPHGPLLARMHVLPAPPRSTRSTTHRFELLHSPKLHKIRTFVSKLTSAESHSTAAATQ